MDGKDKSMDMDGDRLYSKFEDISKYCSEYIRWFAELNISNIEKVFTPDKIEEKENKKTDNDLVEYLQFFQKNCL